MPRPPNILLVVIDAARRDAFSPYDPGACTPTVAGLARRGVAVENAFATAPWTLPSHVAMFTGALACEFGLDQAPGGDPRGVADTLVDCRERLLAHRLGEAGYDTHGLSANLWVSPHSGLDSGFDRFDYLPSARFDRAFSRRPGTWRSTLAWAREGFLSAADSGAARIGAALERAITDAHPGRPQFWFVNLVEAHSPYLPPRPFNDLATPGRVAAALDCHRRLSFEAIALAAAGAGTPPRPVLGRLAHLHRRAVAYTDAWLAGVLATLARTGRLADTLVIVTSDHGECFGEEGLIAHGFHLLDCLVRVPLVAAGPGAERFPQGDDAVSLQALAPLLWAVAGLEEPSARTGAVAAGVAVAHSAPLCRADDARMLDFTERWSLSAAQVARLTADRWLATDGQRRLELTDGHPLSPPTDATDARLLTALTQAREGGAAAPTPAQPPGPAGEETEATVAALERQMRLLGYL
ncbi:sulfatase [Conexibacter sp. DBS9H8]|uniref:sulfatase n=1 Tax=Conexibacter sp. DBS9H8 TaxID=2937801 RepID=UPI00200C3F7C|nr:sulfatase [Conexibacter sp. DBS9H8]